MIFKILTIVRALFSLSETTTNQLIRIMKKLIFFICLLAAVSCVQETEGTLVKDIDNIFRMDSSTNIRITSALIDTTSPESIVSSRWDKDYMRGTVYSSLSLE